MSGLLPGPSACYQDAGGLASKMPDVVREVNELQSEVESMAKTCGQLETRLAGVLRPSGPDPEKIDKGMKPPRTCSAPLAERIESIKFVVIRVSSILQDIQGRLEI